jgi:hypothetical protein
MPQAVAGFIFSALAWSGVSVATAAFLATVVVNLGTAILLSMLSSALTSKRASTTNQDKGRDLAQPTTAPSVRAVYGHTLATGTPAGSVVVGDYIYGCWVLNSRWSDLGNMKLYLDKREVTYTGDPFDFTGAGATATNEPFLKDGTNHVTFWIGRGDKTTPPTAFTGEAPYIAVDRINGWKTTDSWRGLTTVWCKIAAGEQETRQDRWPSAPPFVEVEADWSRVYDPRAVGHVFGTESTWAYSNNLALCVLDALKTSPVRPYQESNLDIASFSSAADICDQDRALNSGGTEKEFVLAGTLVYSNGELEDQVLPMIAAGAAYLIRAGGILGIQMPVYQTPSQTHTDFLGNSLNAVDMLTTSELVNELRTTYTSVPRLFESAELKPYTIPGALAQDGGLPSVANLDLNFSPSATQAMRVRKISAGLLRRQKTLNVVLNPIALDLLPGSTITLDLPIPFNKFNGVWEVQSVQPGMDMYGSEDSCAMMVPVTLLKHSSTIYDWNPATDEEAVEDAEYVAPRRLARPPGAISTEVLYVNTGGVIETKIKFLFDPSPSKGVINYTWHYSEDGGTYQSGGSVSTSAFDSVDPTKLRRSFTVSDTSSYVIRVRTNTSYGASTWVYSSEVTADLALTSVLSFGEVGQVRFTGTTPVSPNFTTIRVYENSVDDFTTSTQLGTADTSYGSNVAFDIAKTHATGTAFYYIVPFTSTGLQGTVSGAFELTVT